MAGWGETAVGQTYNGPLDMRQQIYASSFSIGSSHKESRTIPQRSYQPFVAEARATSDCKQNKSVCGTFTGNVVVGNDRRDFSRSAGVHGRMAKEHYIEGEKQGRGPDSRGSANKWIRERGDVRIGTDRRNFSTANQVHQAVDFNSNRKIPRSLLLGRKVGPKGELASNFNHSADIETVQKPVFATSNADTHVFDKTFYDPEENKFRISEANNRKHAFDKSHVHMGNARANFKRSAQVHADIPREHYRPVTRDMTSNGPDSRASHFKLGGNEARTKPVYHW